MQPPDPLPPCPCAAEPREYVCCVPARYGIDCPSCGRDTLDCEPEEEAREEWRRVVKGIGGT